jgi:hypothetical protein
MGDGKRVRRQVPMMEGLLMSSRRRRLRWAMLSAQSGVGGAAGAGARASVSVLRYRRRTAKRAAWPGLGFARRVWLQCLLTRDREGERSVGDCGALGEAAAEPLLAFVGKGWVGAGGTLPRVHERGQCRGGLAAGIDE